MMTFLFPSPDFPVFVLIPTAKEVLLLQLSGVIAFELPDPEILNIPEDVMSVSDFTKGMVLVTGPAGSGKSTTMACIVDRINHSREGHIITLEDPLEYLHRHD